MADSDTDHVSTTDEDLPSDTRDLNGSTMSVNGYWKGHKYPINPSAALQV